MNKQSWLVVVFALLGAVGFEALLLPEPECDRPMTEQEVFQIQLGFHQ